MSESKSERTDIGVKRSNDVVIEKDMERSGNSLTENEIRAHRDDASIVAISKAIVQTESSGISYDTRVIETPVIGESGKDNVSSNNTEEHLRLDTNDTLQSYDDERNVENDAVRYSCEVVSYKAGGPHTSRRRDVLSPTQLLSANEESSSPIDELSSETIVKIPDNSFREDEQPNTFSEASASKELSNCAMTSEKAVSGDGSLLVSPIYRDEKGDEITKSRADGDSAQCSTAAADNDVVYKDFLTDQSDSFYNVKWVKFRDFQRPVVMQNENGPCPLIAIMNILLLERRVRLPLTTEVITSVQLMEHLGDCVFENSTKTMQKEMLPNQERNMHDAINVFHRLQTGLDVNVKFTGVGDFEYTQETVIFDLLNIPLYHGWLVDPQEKPEYRAAVGNYSYNQLVEKIVSFKSSNDTSRVTEALLAQSFLEESASQLTYHGLCELATTVKESQLSVFFRNNHFSTLYKYKGELFLLVTDQGFLHEPNVVWETLQNVEGDCHFVDANFRTYCRPEVPSDVYAGSPQQIDHDYNLALYLQQEQSSSTKQVPSPVDGSAPTPQDLYQQDQTKSDYELALALQEESVRDAQLGIQNRAASRQQDVPPPPPTTTHKNSSCRII